MLLKLTYSFPEKQLGYRLSLQKQNKTSQEKTHRKFPRTKSLGMRWLIHITVTHFSY